MDKRSHTNKSSGIKKSSDRSSGDPYPPYRLATAKSSKLPSNARGGYIVHQERARVYNPADSHSAYDRGKRWRGGGGGGGGSGTGYGRGSLDLEAREHHHARENVKKGPDEATSDKESYEGVESSIKHPISLPDSNSEEDSHTDVGSFEVSNTAGNESRNPRPQATTSALSNYNTSCPDASRPADLPGRPAHSTSPPGRSDYEDTKFHPAKLKSTFDSQKVYLSEAPVDIFPDNIPRNRELSNAASHLSEASSLNDTKSRNGQKPEIATCTNCFTQSTPLWRYDTERQLLCNACGLFLKLHGRARPLSLKAELIKKRNRGSQANLPIGKIVTSPYDRMTTRSMRMTPKEQEHALRWPSDGPRLPASTDTNAEPQSSRTQLYDVKIEESAEAERIEDPTRLSITVDKPFMRNYQPLRLLPERSERIQLTIRRLTESIYSHCQAHNGRFREHTASSSHTSSSSSTSSRSEQETTQAAPSSSQSQRPMKRRKISQNPDGEESDEEGKTSNTSKGKEKESPPRFACLYFKHDRSQYGDRRQWRECSGPGWPDMHRLKEHLFRKHMKAKHCYRCWKTFKDASALADHQRSKSQCDVLPEKTIDGLTELQATQLRARKTFSKMEEFAKWRKAYMIIFPDVTENQIPEPYYIPEDFYDFSFVNISENPKAYLRRELPARISNKLMAQLKKKNIGHDDVKALCEKAVYEALDDLSRSTHEPIGTQYDSKIPITHINSENPITAISQTHEWSQEPVVSSTFTWDVADLEAEFDPSFLDQSIDQFVGDPGLDFLSEHPGLPQGHSALSSLEEDVDCLQFSWATKEISDSGYNSLLGAGSHTSPLPQ